MYRKQKTVTQYQTTPSQPGVSVSVTVANGRAELHVRRWYNDLPNSFGGRGVSKKCDCDGLVFATSDEAFAFALRRGYLTPFYSEATRAAKANREARIARRIGRL